ncbi:tRNA1(Val) (adenine(37)-N6)-methyltransferase [Campylobacter sp. 7477a]|uniref:tRNA1(Val) (adenine(37)-N6)-methyltransferase n=1 Tax=Campylobacter sp. 7477a TaxID=2735741 RepID=UPI003014F059|nr:methyltransferase [Campylobacter sp. 7477a]
MILSQLKDGYRYNSDTLMLYGFICENLNPWFKGRVLDVGCGCGILGLLLKRDFSGMQLSLLDVQEINLDISRKNAAENFLEIKTIMADFNTFKDGNKFELIVSNPPFYHEGVKQSQNKHTAISRYASFLGLREFLYSANQNLKSNAELIFCYDAICLNEIFTLLDEFKIKPICIKFVHSKEQSCANLVLIRAKKGSRSKCKILPPIILMKDGSYSKEANEIFKKADTKSKGYE